MRLYNTKTKKLEEFKPKNPEEVSLYTCGPTVYSAPHIGNFAAYIYWDLLVRALKANNFKVKRVLNLTDVGHLTSDADSGEDKLEKGAKKEGKTVWEIADYYINVFKSGFKKLNLLEPELWARATDYIEADKTAVEKMTENGFTYETSDGIYFDTSKFEAYPDFAKLDLKNLKAGARVEFNEEKKNPSDFAVWKFIKPGESHAMRWDFLGRPGYPGWHLECSTIIEKEFKNLPIDLHTGGVDHIPVHHTNEIAQNFAVTGKPLADFWLHCNFLKINDEKVSKSLGNILTLEDLEEKGYSVFDFKLWLYQGSYHNERNFTFEDLTAARSRRLKWRNHVALLYQSEKKAIMHIYSEDPIKQAEINQKKEDIPYHEFKNNLLNCLSNDLNSADAFAYIEEKTNKMSIDCWRFVDKIFGLNILEDAPDLTSKYSNKIDERNKARYSNDFETADKIRDELKKQNITLVDTAFGTVWQFSS
ncbi:cysteine--tRNA ligase [Candidatus Saccharibacteria bacterium]|nr:cysteine--tRNA ligase [Candidatus Saccharibacteria bacterium]